MLSAIDNYQIGLDAIRASSWDYSEESEILNGCFYAGIVASRYVLLPASLVPNVEDTVSTSPQDLYPN